jgi:predicted DCC family thiol-disulfide oxidoreductase YuxK
MPSAETLGWVLYDAGCGICSRWVPLWAPTLARLGLGIAPLQDPWVVDRLRLPPDELLRDLRLLLADGRALTGADAYRYVMRRLWWAWPLYALASAPLLRRIFDRAYRAFADHRHRLSSACGLHGGGRRRDQGGPGAGTAIL